MKILFVFTGGTIGSTLSGSVMLADKKKSYGILSAYFARHAADFAYDVTEPYLVQSENSTGEHLRSLISCVQQNLHAGYDGIVITHGTDTLQYAAAAVGYAIGADTVPVCLVSSQKPIEEADANGLDNLHAAVTLIRRRAGRGAFVCYRNSTEQTVRVHRATRLLAGIAYTDEVRSSAGQEYGHFDTAYRFHKNPAYREQADGISPLSADGLSAQAEGILCLTSHPGMQYPTQLTGIRYVLLHTYHSGTVDTASDAALAFFAAARESGVCVYVTGVYKGPVYESASRYAELGILPLTDLSPVAAYVKLWLLAASGRAVQTELFCPLAGDL